MSGQETSAMLQGALRLSEQIMAVAEGNDLRPLTALDAERMQLLKSFKPGHRLVSASERALLEQIMLLNDRAVGMLEHRKRGKGREMDMVTVGRRAVAAYANVKMQR